MNVAAGELFSLTDIYSPVPGCTVSGDLVSSKDASVTAFSLAAGTGISAGIWQEPRLLLVLSGEIQVEEPDLNRKIAMKTGEALIIEAHTLTGVTARSDAVYVEITLCQGSFNASLPVGEAFVLKDRVPVQPGRIVNMDLAVSEELKFVIMSFDADTGLSGHAAPGDALLFGLEGSAVVGYEGTDHILNAGENFKFAAGGRHTVRADGPFVMALLMELPARE